MAARFPRLGHGVLGRLLPGYALIIALLALTWAFATFATSQMDVAATHTIQVDDRLLSNVTQRIKLMDDEETGLRGYLLTGDRDFLAPYVHAHAALPRLRAEGAAIADHIPGARESLRTMLGAAVAWDGWARSVLRHPSVNPGTPGATAQQVEGKRLFDRFRATSANVVQRISADRQHDLARVRDTGRVLDVALGVIFVIAVIGTAVIGALTVQAIVRPLIALGTAAAAIGEGNLQDPVHVTGADEFVELARSMDSMRRDLADEAARRGETERGLRDRGAHLAAIVEAQSAITAAVPNLDAVLGLAIDRAQRLTGSSGAVIELVEGEETVCWAACGSVQNALGMRLGLASSFSGLAVQSGKSLRSDDTERDHRVDRQACRSVGARSLVVVPLRAGSEVAGVLKVISAEPGAFDDHAVDTLQLMAGETAAAMRTSLAFDANQKLLAELSAANDRLHYQALHDALTGLPNRTLFHDRLDQGIQSALRRDDSMAVLLIDLDGFKGVNDSLGHHAGDVLLQEVASRLTRSLRGSDSVARLGGDEFAVILQSVGPSGAEHVARRLHAALRQPLVLDGSRVQVDASIGTAMCPQDGETGDVLLRCADVAMYAAKTAHVGYVSYEVDGASLPAEERKQLAS